MIKIPFTKPALLVSQQIDLLEGRGMVIDDRVKAEHYLEHLNYYRLGAYWLPFESDHTTHTFAPGTSFRRVLDHYVFDRELRLLVLDAIERIEVSTRSLWAHQMGIEHGSHSHLDPRFAVNHVFWQKNYGQLEEEVRRSTETFIIHFRDRYSEALPPVWAASEVMSLGLLSKWYNNLQPVKTRQNISRAYGLDHLVFGSWLHHLSYVRNICAHHSRLWNREFTVTPKIPRSKPVHLNAIMKPKKRKIYNTFVLLDYLLDVISPNHTWKQRLNELIDEYRIETIHMDFPSKHL